MTLTELFKFSKGFCRRQNIPCLSLQSFICHLHLISFNFANHDLTRRHVFGDIKWICNAGELGRVVVDVLHGDVQPHVRRLFPIVCTHQQGVFRTPLPIQLLGGDQITRFGVNPKAVICSTDDGVCHKSIGTLRRRQKMKYYRL